MELVFVGTVIEWRGPSPYYFVPVPETESSDVREIASMATYGWGVIPVEARSGVGRDVRFSTGAATPGRRSSQPALARSARRDGHPRHF